MLKILNHQVELNPSIRKELFVLAITNGLTAYEDYVFPFAPTDLTDQEQYAVTISPMYTTAPHAYISEIGIASKVISLRGNTGVKPKMSVYEEVFGRTFIPDKYKSPTGMQLFLNLQDFLHGYFQQLEDIKERNEDISQLQMHLFNYRLGEFYLVKPLSFVKTQSGTHPLQYFYQLDLSVIGESNIWETYKTKYITYGVNYDTIVNSMSDWKQRVIEAINSLAKFTSLATVTARQLYNNIENSLDQITLVLESSIQSVKALEKYYKYMGSGVKNSLNALNNALNQAYINNDSEITIPIDKGATYNYNYTTAIDSGAVNNVLENLNSLNTFEATSSFNRPIQNMLMLNEGYSDAIDLILNMYNVVSSPIASDSINQQLENYNKYQDIIDSLNMTDVNTTSTTINTDIEILNRISNTDTISKPNRLGIIQNNNKYKHINITSFDTIYSLAQKYLGDWNRWQELVLINNLEYPYFSKDGKIGTVKYGESILIPVNTDISINDLYHLEEILKKHTLLNITDTYLGFDIRSKNNDIVLNHQLDFEFIAGINAFMQAIDLLLTTHLGAKITMPLYGNPIEIGSKAPNIFDLKLYQEYIRKTLLKDDRVKEIKELRLSIENNVYRVRLSIEVKTLDNTLTLGGEI